MLRIQKIEKEYMDGDKKRKVLKGIDYEFFKGKLYTIAGPTGAGKTTFLSIIAGLDIPSEGDILYNEKNINNIGLNNYRREIVSIVFQSYNLINYMTALENVVTAMEISGDIKDKEKIAREKLLNVGLDEDKINRTVNKLSGGEQQRVAIARSIATNPEIILADEPTGNLDSKIQREIIEIFQKLAHKENKCVIVVTHSEEFASKADVNINLKDGKFK